MASISARNRFVDCAFEETVSGQLNQVIFDEGAWWMVVEHEYSLRFEDCFFKRADRLTPFSQFLILEVENAPNSEWQWDELLNDEWIAPNYEHAITGDHKNWGHSPRLQFVDTNENESAVEQDHSAGLLTPEIDNHAPTVKNPIPSIAVGKDAEPRKIDLHDVFEDVETADADMSFSVNANSESITSEIVDGTLILEYANISSTLTITVTATDDDLENPLSVSTTFSATILIDEDNDGLNDEFEQTIIDFDPNDKFASLEDVLPEADFDGDGYSNQLESINNKSPTDLTSKPSDLSALNYSLVDLGKHSLYGSAMNLSNKGHVLLNQIDRNSNIHYRRWYWGDSISFLGANSWQDEFRPHYIFSDMNNHGEIVGIRVAKRPYRSYEFWPCYSAYNDLLPVEIINFYRQLVVIQKDGSVSIKTPPAETKGQHSFDNTYYATSGMNDNGDFLLLSIPHFSFIGNYLLASSTTLGALSHKYKNGTFTKLSTNYQYKYVGRYCLKTIYLKNGTYLASDSMINNSGYLAGAGLHVNKWKDSRGWKDSEGILDSGNHQRNFGFLGSLQNEVNCHIFDLNENNLAIGSQFGVHSVSYLFEGVNQYNTPNIIGTDKFRRLSSPKEGEALILMSNYHLAVQKRDPQNGDLVPLPNGADAYAITSAEQILHKPDANGNSTQNAEWSDPIFRQISDNGNFIVGSAIKNGAKHVVLWVKMDMAVDNNRDGTIDFGNDLDKTGEDKPYTFWINNDYDSSEGDNPDGNTPNYSDGTINGIRDLEDFTRLHIDVSSILPMLKDNTLDMALKFKDTTGSPSIKLWAAKDPDGGEGYLEDISIAQEHLSLSAPGVINGSTSYVIAQQFWDGLPDGTETAYLLYEGSGIGKGRLTIELQKNGQALYNGPSVWLELKDIQSMYERAEATPHSLNDPYNELSNGDPQVPSIGWVAKPDGFPFEEAWDEDADNQNYIIFAHGWRMSYPAARTFAESFYKRLWHRGYKGRYAFFRWHTYYFDLASKGKPPCDFDVLQVISSWLSKYNESEYRAWKYGEGLKGFVEGLPSSYNKHVAAHSMGNVVASSAIEKGLEVESYALLQAAMPATCFDGSYELYQNPAPGRLGYTYWNRPTPDDHSNPAVRALCYKRRIPTTNANLINCYQINDCATKDAWEANNEIFKPYPIITDLKWYEYDMGETTSADEVLTIRQVSIPSIIREVADAPENMAFLNRSRTKALGAEPRTGGAIDEIVNLDTFNFDKVHSAEFVWEIQRLKGFYNMVLDQFFITRKREMKP